MDMLPDRFSFPRVDALFDIRYAAVDSPDTNLAKSEGGVSFAMRSREMQPEIGDFVELKLCFTYGNVVQEMRSIALCRDLFREDGETIGVFQFIDAPPELVEGVRSMACLHLLRLNHAQSGPQSHDADMDRREAV